MNQGVLYLKRGDTWQPLSDAQMVSFEPDASADDTPRTYVPRGFEIEVTVTTWNDSALLTVPAPSLDFAANDDGSTTLSLSARQWPHKRPSRFRGYGGINIRADGDAWKAKPIYTIGRSAAGRARRIRQKRRTR